MFYKEKALKIRKSKKLNSGYVANALSVSTSTLWSWENGRRNPSNDNIIRLAKILDIPVTDISDLKQFINSDYTSMMSNEFDNISEIFSKNKELTLINQNKQALKQIDEITSELGRIASVFRAVIKNMNMIFYVKDVNQNYVIANEAFIKNVSLNIKYIVKGKKDKDFFSIEDAKYLTAEDEHILETEEPVLHREGYIPGSRRKKIGLTSKFPFYDSSGNLAGIICIIDDITERYKESKIRKLLEQTLNFSSDVIFLRKAAKSRKYFYISDSVELLYGYPKECFFEDPLFWETKCIHPEDKNIAVTFSNICMESKIKKYRIITKSGKICHIEANVLCHEINGEKYVCAIERKK
jgi:PAS domain-containing protein